MIDEKKIIKTLKKTAQLAEIYESKLNLGFSGGKDSVVLKYFADVAGIDYVANFNNTQIESYGGMLPFIKNNYPDVKIINPDKADSFFVQMKKKGVPSMFRRWCCETLKHSSPKLAQYRVNIMGVRGEESAARMERGSVSVFGNSKRAQLQREKLAKTFASTSTQIHCEGGKDKVNIYPIFDLTGKEVFEIIKSENLVIPEVYYTGCGRIGCAFCPFASRKENYQIIETRPRMARMWISTFDDEFIKRRQSYLHGKTDGIGLFYLYINDFLCSIKDIDKGLNTLSEKDLFGNTGRELFISYLQKHNVI